MRLDVQAFCKEAAKIDGRWPLAQCERVAEVMVADGEARQGQEVVDWHAAGEQRRPRGGQVQPWLHLSARTRLALACQRCLQPVRMAIEVDRNFRFVEGENQAAEIDAESEDDVLALPRALDLRELVEDELLLALPLVPRHAVCPEPLPWGAGSDAPAESKANPFAALAALKRGGAPN